MRHNCKKGKLNRTHSHRLALMRNMAASLIKSEHGIRVSLASARVLRRYLEPLITFAKRKDDDVFTIRYLLPKVANDKEVTKKIMVELARKYADRPGGYLRIIKCGYRQNDRMPLALVQFI